MTTHSDLDQLENASERAAAEAIRARRAAVEEKQRQGDERARREQKWRADYCDAFDRAGLKQAVRSAAADLQAALENDPLGAALMAYAKAMITERDSLAFAAVTASQAGLDPVKVAGYDPLVQGYPQATLAQGGYWDGSLTSLLNLEAAASIQPLAAQANQDRQANLDTFATDDGKLTQPATEVATPRCAACTQCVPKDQLYVDAHARVFHDDDRCRPRQPARDVGDSHFNLDAVEDRPHRAEFVT